MLRSAIKGLLIFSILGFIGCGVKGPPVPYVSTLPPSPTASPNVAATTEVTETQAPVSANAEKEETRSSSKKEVIKKVKKGKAKPQ